MDLVGLLLSIVVGLIPTVIYSGFVNWLDQYEKEPWWLLTLAFVWGTVPAATIALLAQWILDIPTTWLFSGAGLAYEILGSGVWAPITEEIAKGLGVVIILVLAHREMDSVLDGIIYGAMAGLGFALTENVLYLASVLTEDGWGSWAIVVLLRTIPFGLNHALFSGLTGAGLATADLHRKTWARFAAPFAGLAAGVVLHSIHNLGAALAQGTCWTICVSFLLDWGGVLFLSVLVVLIWRQEKSWIAEQLPGEVSDDLYRLIASWRRWQSARWSVLLQGDTKTWRRLHRVRRAAIELAFKKHRLAVSGPHAKTEQEIDGYRRQLAELNSQSANS